MPNCIVGALIVVGALILFAMWLHREGGAQVEKEISRRDKHIWKQDLIRYLADWEHATGLNFDAQSPQQQQMVIGGYFLPFIKKG